MQNEELNTLMKEFDRNYAYYYTDIGKEQGLEDEVIAKPPEIKNLIIKAYHTGQTAERERIRGKVEKIYIELHNGRFEEGYILNNKLLNSLNKK